MLNNGLEIHGVLETNSHYRKNTHIKKNKNKSQLRTIHLLTLRQTMNWWKRMLLEFISYVTAEPIANGIADMNKVL